MNTDLDGTKLGRSRAQASPTLITLCCRRRWRNGPLTFSPQCCRGIPKSCTRLIAVFSMKCAQRSPATRPGSGVSRSSIKETRPRYVWHIWVRSVCVPTRRFVPPSHPGPTQLITTRIGDGWLKDLNQLRKLEPLADDADFQQQWREVKLANKRRFATLILARTGIKIAPESLFDVQVKRIHESQ